MRKIKLLLSALFLGGLVVSCDSDTNELGLQFFDGVEGETTAYDLVVYNVDNGDVVRGDAYALKKATLGVFAEEQFGMQKSAYVSQVRLSSYAPDFGTNPVVDSVVLEFRPEYYTASDSITTTTQSLTYKGETSTQTLTTYKAVKYGKANKELTLQVREVLDNIGNVGDEILSNRVVSEGTILGTKTFNGDVSAVSIVKASDNTSLLSKNAGVRISLDKDFFQSKIADKNGSAELADEQAFVNYFNGLKLSVAENDGFLVYFDPASVSLTMYYTSGEEDNRASKSFSFDMGTSNAYFSQISYDRSSTFKNIMANIDVDNGNSKLYVQGMGGSGFGVKLSGESIENLKTLYREKGNSILSAKIRVYTDVDTWNNAYAKPTGFLVKQSGSSEFLTDLTTMLYNTNYNLVSAYAVDSNPAYYDINITKTIKDIVEQGAEPKDLVINIGEYLMTNNRLVVEAYNTNVYSPYRAVLIGTDLTNDNRAKLMITSVAK